jgi:hypothetical protein
MERVFNLHELFMNSMQLPGIGLSRRYTVRLLVLKREVLEVLDS